MQPTDGLNTGMKAKTVNASRIIMNRIIQPQDANTAGIAHGGVVMKQIDDAAGAVAIRHARKIAVTASIDRLDFHHPVYIGNLLIVKASLNMAGRTSMEVGVRVEAEDLLTGKIKHTASAYLTFVALDENSKPAPIAPLILEGEEEIRRNKEARQRKQIRLAEKKIPEDCLPPPD